MTEKLICLAKEFALCEVFSEFPLAYPDNGYGCKDLADWFDCFVHGKADKQVAVLHHIAEIAEDPDSVLDLDKCRLKSDGTPLYVLCEEYEFLTAGMVRKVLEDKYVMFMEFGRSLLSRHPEFD